MATNQNLLNGQVITAAQCNGGNGIAENGTHYLWSSNEISSQNDNSVEVTVTYEDNLPDPEVSVAKYNLVTILETKDAAGNWHPFHYQFQPFVKQEFGNKHILIFNPRIFNLDEGVPSTISNGLTNIAVESRKQGSLSDNFRICVVVNEFGFDENGATAASFNQVKLTVSYEIDNI